MSKIWIVAALAALSASPALAQPYRSSEVEIVNAAARLTVIPEDRADIAVQITPGARLPTPTVRLVAGRVVIDGDLDRRIEGCDTSLGVVGRARSTTVRISAVGRLHLEDLPAITLRVPARVDLNASGAVFAEIGESAGGRVRLRGCGDSRMGAASNDLDITLAGSGSLEAGAVHGALVARLSGSGDVTVASARAADVQIDGSGELAVGDISGVVVALLNGSGDIDLGSVGDARLSLRGSGELTAGAVNGALTANLNGSGDVEVASVNGGEVSLTLDGSGEVAVRGGRTQRLVVRIAGSGDVRFDGEAQEVSADLHGSGDVVVASTATLPVVRSRGSGELHIGL